MLKRFIKHRKYFKPTSITWWTGFLSFTAGMVIAVGGEVDALMPAANVLSAMVAVPPAAMITYGLGIIGLRGKDG